MILYIRELAKHPECIFIYENSNSESWMTEMEIWHDRSPTCIFRQFWNLILNMYMNIC